MKSTMAIFKSTEKCLSAKQVSVSCSVCWYEGNMCRYAVSWAGAEDKAEGTVPGGLGSVAERAVSVLWMAMCVCVRHTTWRAREQCPVGWAALRSAVSVLWMARCV